MDELIPGSDEALNAAYRNQLHEAARREDESRRFNDPFAGVERDREVLAAKRTVRIPRSQLTDEPGATPAQWEGRTDADVEFYIRYRWGTLAIGVGNDPIGADYGNIFHEEIGGRWDGYMTTTQLIERIAEIPGIEVAA